jgi:hypothetical protein
MKPYSISAEVKQDLPLIQIVKESKLSLVNKEEADSEYDVPA